MRRHLATVDRLQVVWNGNTSTTVKRQPFKVGQTTGSSFGYCVRPTAAGEHSYLDAFAIRVPNDGVLHSGVIEVVG
ncbi:hypothetical protein [Chthonobacter albigriseus]|uniref:hypothetical protein n=1 Tax=Chthonobacter albigriseus TaxID=1683161 RepID=UPI0015EE3D6E|nr:hypothetical protein [Chthonobacter albigriseus]